MRTNFYSRPYFGLLLLGLVPLLFFSEDVSAHRNRQHRQATKPTVRVVTLGHVDHGKSTLLAAITKVLSESGRARLRTYDSLANSSEARVEYVTNKARYIHLDCRTNDGYVKLLSREKSRLNGAILVVSAADGPMPQTLEHLQLAQAVGIKSIVVYLSKIDLVDDPDLLGIVELETRQLLGRYGFRGNEVRFVNGSALMALNGTRNDIGKNSIIKLLSVMDAVFVR